MSSFNAPAYELARCGGRCAFTDQPLNPGDAYIAMLVEEGDVLKRLDASLAAWDEGRQPEHLFSYWKTIVPMANQKKKQFVDDQVLMNLLQRLADAAQPQRVAFRFVLMLILMRKKMVRYDRTERRPAPPADAAAVNENSSAPVEAPPPQGDQEWWVLTPKLDLTKGPMGKWNEDEKLYVLDPHLDEQSTRQVTDQLGEILQAEL
jgi:hypothetical protein